MRKACHPYLLFLELLTSLSSAGKPSNISKEKTNTQTHVLQRAKLQLLL